MIPPRITAQPLGAEDAAQPGPSTASPRDDFRSIELVTGDSRAIVPARGPFDMMPADPPYGDTLRGWEKRVWGWHALAARCLIRAGLKHGAGMRTRCQGDGARSQYPVDQLYFAHIRNDRARKAGRSVGSSSGGSPPCCLSFAA